MNGYKLVMFALALFTVTTAAAQQSSTQPPQGPVVSKGYYAIGNNAKKLGANITLPVKTVAQSSAAKGYYATGSRLAGQAAYLPLSTKRPDATKGYYRIGNNAGKLSN